ncbi:hypothetical protein SB759_33915, partial [Pseudomonas sp. SIMBA_059]
LSTTKEMYQRHDYPISRLGPNGPMNGNHQSITLGWFEKTVRDLGADNSIAGTLSTQAPPTPATE